MEAHAVPQGPSRFPISGIPENVGPLVDSPGVIRGAWFGSSRVDPHTKPTKCRVQWFLTVLLTRYRLVTTLPTVCSKRCGTFTRVFCSSGIGAPPGFAGVLVRGSGARRCYDALGIHPTSRALSEHCPWPWGRLMAPKVRLRRIL